MSLVGHTLPDQQVVVRNRGETDSSTLRKPEYLPPEEVKLAISRVVAENFGAEQDELIQAVARLFGFGSTSAQLREAVKEAVTELLDSGQLRLDGRLISRVQPETNPT